MKNKDDAILLNIGDKIKIPALSSINKDNDTGLLTVSSKIRCFKEPQASHLYYKIFIYYKIDYAKDSIIIINLTKTFEVSIKKYKIKNSEMLMAKIENEFIEISNNEFNDVINKVNRFIL